MGMFGGTAQQAPRVVGPATLRPYQDTLRDKAALGIMGLFGSGPLAKHFTEGVMGGTGLGHQHTGLIDWVPGLGQIFQADEAGRQIADGHPVAGAVNGALAAIPLPMAAKGAGFGFKKATQAVEGALGRKAAEEVAQSTAPIIAYHGSPHTFDQFDLSKIGTGEGAQDYGHGLYFAENEGVAKGYRDALALPSTPTNDVAKHWMGEAGGDKQKAAELFRAHAAAAAIPSREAAGTLAAIENSGSTYQVGIKARPEHFLDWDAPFQAQPDAVKQAARAVLGPDMNEGYYDTGAVLHRQMEKTLRGDRPYDADGSAVAKALADNGVAGVKYLDQGSRNAGGWHVTPPDETVSGKWMVKSSDYNSQGLHFDTEDEAKAALADKTASQTRNYVVFSPENIEILKRYGLPAILGGGALAGAAATPDNAAAAPRPGMFGSMAPQAPQ